MSQVKKIVLYIFGIALLIFGNRDLLAKINGEKSPAGLKNDEPKTPQPAVADVEKTTAETKPEAAAIPAKGVEATVGNRQEAKPAKQASTEKTAPKVVKKVAGAIVSTEKKAAEEKTQAPVVAGKKDDTQPKVEAPATKVEKDSPEKSSATE